MKGKNHDSSNQTNTNICTGCFGMDNLVSGGDMGNDAVGVVDKPIKVVAMSSELPTRMGSAGKSWLNNRREYEFQLKRVQNVLKNWKKS